jgi:hypothetical protein
MHRQVLLAAALELDDRSGHGGERLAQLERLRVEAVAGRALDAERRHHLAVARQREGGSAAGARFAPQQLVRMRDHRQVGARRRAHHGLALVDHLFHRCLDRAQQVGVLVELRRMRHGAQLDAPSLQDAERDALTAQTRRHFGGEGGGGVAQRALAEQRADEFERKPQPQLCRLRRVGVPAQQHFQPARAPLQLAHCLLKLRLRAPIHFEPDRATQVAVDADRVAELVARRVARRLPGHLARQHYTAALPQRALADLGEKGALARRLGIEGDGDELG